MPYVDIGQKTTDIGHCQYCGFQWVITPTAKGKSYDRNEYPVDGRRCPSCGSNNIRYEKESNR